MKKFLVILLAVVAVGAFAFSLEELKVSVFGNYNFVVSATSTTSNATAANYLDFGIDLTYPVAENMELGLGLGFAYLLGTDATPLFSVDATPSQSALDLFAVFKYSVELDRESRVVIRGFGGPSWPMNKFDFGRFGWVFGIGASYTRDFEGLVVGLGAGVEMRIYNKNNVIAVPVGGNFEINF